MPSTLKLKASDIMKKATSAMPNIKIKDAAKLMDENSIGCVVVTSPEDKVIGIFTERDLTRVVANGIPLDKSLGDVMTKNPWTVKESDGISKVVTLMYEKGIRHLPVVDSEGRLKGLILVRDLTGILTRLTSYE
ncbi:MAG: CBS domain-containing protein [Caldisphaeraceae archaeon]|nr:CBS domain-containing protein [Caldisphaeraceae archaeon]